ncbi:MAG: DUF951 domain-containing protein [Anaerolineae bacterium]|nr:DUF951 domain-containing protein [Anaerolineae bacterium]
MPREVHIGDLVTTRKAHPCGSTAWEVYRIGADIGLKCLRCGRRVLLTRRAFERAARTIRPPSPGETTKD